MSVQAPDVVRKKDVALCCMFMLLSGCFSQDQFPDELKDACQQLSISTLHFGQLEITRRAIHRTELTYIDS